MNEFSKADIERLFNIKRTRLQEWIDREFVKPSILHKQGKGNKSVFSLNDLYKIKLIDFIVSKGFTRFEAKYQSHGIDFKNIGKERGQKQYLVTYSGLEKSALVGDTELVKSIDGIKLHKGNISLFIVDLVAIKNEVDNLLKVMNKETESTI